MITLTQLKYIVSLAKEKHFGRAAKECNVSQPSLSTQIQKVEESLGIVLFDRSKKPVLLTKEGIDFVNKAKQILASVQSLEHSAKNSKDVSGEFLLGVIPTLAPYLLPMFLESFSTNYPDVNLKIYELTTAEILKKLYDDELDGGLLVTPLRDDKIIERALFSELFYLFPNKKHRLYGAKEVNYEDLEFEDKFWILNEGHCMRDQVLNICRFKEKNKSNLLFESGSLETIKNLIKNGGGLSIIPQMAAIDIKKDVVPFKEPSPARQVGLVHSRSFLKERILDALESEILKSLPKEIKNLKVAYKNIEITN
jgi:LysR family hydrogen peroxide-inducible transcriptional activator